MILKITLICLPFTELEALCDINYQKTQIVIIYQMTPEHAPCIGQLWDRVFWLEENGGVHWISSFVMEYSFLWLSAPSDHVDLCYIECDNSTIHLAIRFKPLCRHCRAWTGLLGYLVTTSNGQYSNQAVLFVLTFPFFFF